MTLYGLCATGNVRWLDAEGEVIDEDECTIGDFNGKPRWLIASDVRSFLTDWSSVPQPSRREAVISAMIAEGVNPPRTISWKEFYKRVRDGCNARLDAKGRAPFLWRQDNPTHCQRLKVEIGHLGHSRSINDGLDGLTTAAASCNIVRLHLRNGPQEIGDDENAIRTVRSGGGLSLLWR